MKKIVTVALITAGIVAGVSTNSFASDWDKAGKVFAIIEGVRVITGGKVDVIGTITGINRQRQENRECEQVRESERPRYARGYAYGRRSHFEECERIWVAHYVWREKYIPEHIEYRNGRKVVVEGHYEKYMVEEGGHWEETCRRNRF